MLLFSEEERIRYHIGLKIASENVFDLPGCLDVVRLDDWQLSPFASENICSDPIVEPIDARSPRLYVRRQVAIFGGCVGLAFGHVVVLFGALYLAPEPDVFSLLLNRQKS